MQLSVHRTSSWYSHPSNWHCPPSYHPNNPRPLRISHHGYQKAPHWHPNSTPRGSQFCWTPQQSIRPKVDLNPSATSDVSMSQILTIFDFVFFSVHMSTPLQDILCNKDTPPSLNTLLLVQTSCLCQGLLQAMHHLFLCQTHTPQTLWTSKATSDSWEALEFHLHEFHRAAPSVLW